MEFKNNRSNPTGNQKARPNSTEHLGSWSCKHLLVCIHAELLWTRQVCSCPWSCWLAPCLPRELNCSVDQGMRDDCKGSDLHSDAFFWRIFFKFQFPKHQVSNLCSTYPSYVSHVKVSHKNYGWRAYSKLYTSNSLMSASKADWLPTAPCVCASVCPLLCDWIL